MASTEVFQSNAGVIGWRKPRSNLRKVFKPRTNFFVQENSSSELANCLEKAADFETELRAMQEMMTKLKIEKERVEGELRAKKLEHDRLQQEIKKLRNFKEINANNLAMAKKLGMKEQRKRRQASTQYKRPSPPFILWCKDQWKEVEKEKPDADPKEITDMMVAKWKTISEEEKKEYENKYKTQKEAFLEALGDEKREIEATRLSEREEKQECAIDYLEQYFQFKENKKKSKERRHKKRQEIDANKPRRPGSAFMLFSKEERKNVALERPGINNSAINSFIAAKWKELKVEDKKVWFDMAAEAMKAYKLDIQEYYKKEAQTTTADTESLDHTNDEAQPT